MFKSKDIVEINYEGNDDQNGWRRGQIFSIDKAVVIYIFSFFSFSLFFCLFSLTYSGIPIFLIKHEIYDIQQIRCLYYNERGNNYEMGWFFVNNPNKVRPIDMHDHGHTNSNHDTISSQSDVHANYNIEASNEDDTTDNQIKPSISSTSIPITKSAKRKRKRTKNHKCVFCTKMFYNKQERETHENKNHKFIKPYSCHYRGCNQTFYGANTKRRHQRKCHTEWYEENKKNGIELVHYNPEERNNRTKQQTIKEEKCKEEDITLHDRNNIKMQSSHNKNRMDTDINMINKNEAEDNNGQ